jgi:L-asparaginase II
VDGRLDTDVMTALPDKVFAKSGAEGGYALALKAGGLGVALKIEDGGGRALNPAVVAVLEQLGVITPTAREALAPYAQPLILNHRQEEVGRIKAVVKL